MMERTVEAGGVSWLNAWASMAVPGARLMVGPVDVTGDVRRDLADRVKALDAAGLIIAVWKSTRHGWEWHLRRTGRDLPASWPKLPGPATVQAVLGHAGTGRGRSDAGAEARRKAA
jgi:hypothetical protein